MFALVHVEEPSCLCLGCAKCFVAWSGPRHRTTICGKEIGRRYKDPWYAADLCTPCGDQAYVEYGGWDWGRHGPRCLTTPQCPTMQQYPPPPPGMPQSRNDNAPPPGMPPAVDDAHHPATDVDHHSTIIQLLTTLNITVGELRNSVELLTARVELLTARVPAGHDDQDSASTAGSGFAIVPHAGDTPFQ